MRRRTRRFSYGPGWAQTGTLHTPHGAALDGDVLVLVHGGFWRWPYGRWATWLVARDAVSHGHTVLNLGYRRLGRFGGGGGWPHTFDDVGDAIGLIADQRPDSKVVVIGHSAGGHLALVAAARRPEAVSGVIAIAAPTNLRSLVDNGSIPAARLVEGSPSEDRWALTSPIEMLPTGVRTVCVHSDADQTVRPVMSERYVEAALLAGDDSRLVRVADDVHSDALRPGHVTWIEALAAAEDWLACDNDPSGHDDLQVGDRIV
jgi:acetyl esterase/lipase